MLIVVPASEFSAGAEGYRLAQVTGRAYPDDIVVPGWFEDCYPELSEVKDTAEAAADVARGLGFEVRS